MADPTLSEAALNRALLARQHLLERSDRSLVEVVEDMGGIQTQYAPAGYIALWSRMHRFERRMLTSALERRTVVQGTMLRATIHTVSAADYGPLMAGVRRVNREWFGRVQARELSGIDMDAAAHATHELVAAGPMPMRKLNDALASRGFPPAAAKAVGLWVDLLRIPPSGTWERRRADLYGLAATWIAPIELTEDEGIEHLVRRYLGAFGPAPLRDIASWMGLNVGQIRHVVERMELRPFRDESGRPLVDLPDASLPDPGTLAPPRFVPVWDAMLLVHARRTGVLPEAYRPALFNTRTPHSTNSFLLDGRVAGTWRWEDGEVVLEPMRPLAPAERAELEEEAHRLTVLYGSEA